MTADFRESLNICRSKNNLGEPSFLPLYDFAWAKTDLSDNTVTIIDWNTEITIGEACKLIDDFGGSEATIKARISCFLSFDYIALKEEY